MSMTDEEYETETEWRERMRRGLYGLKSLIKDIQDTRKALTPTKRIRGPRRKLPRCPKCGGTPARYCELWRDHTMDFEADENGMPDEEGYMEPGHAYRVSAICGECGHHWYLKGVSQITDLRELT